MEYSPRYQQPFTLSEAIALDVSTITDEIARLHNSLKHLRETQDQLREYQLTEEPGTADPEVQKALEENEVVIGSQTERISILKMALTEKGILDNRHYEIHETNIVTGTTPGTGQEASLNPTTARSHTNGYRDSDTGSDGEAGIHL